MKLLRTIGKSIASVIAMVMLLGVAVFAIDYYVACTGTDNDSVYAYIRGISGVSEYSAQIGNVKCENVTGGTVRELGIPVKTVLLLDNTKSTNKLFGEGAKQLLKDVVSSHADGEQFKVVTITGVASELTGYSDNYDEIINIIDGIEYEYSETYLTDVIYELLQSEKQSGEEALTRIFVITDGADDNEIKYTKDELNNLLKTSNIPVHTFGLKDSNNAALLENLFSYSRLSGGTFFLADGTSDMAVVLGNIASDYDMYCVKVTPDVSLMDGSQKQMKINLKSDQGDVEVSAPVTMPFGVMEEVVEEVTEEEVVEELPVEEVIEEEEDTEEVLEEAEDNNKTVFLIVCIACILAAVIVIAIIIILIIENKKRKQDVNEVITSSSKVIKVQSASNSSANAGKSAATGQSRQGAAGKPAQARVQSSNPRQTVVILKDTVNPAKEYRAILSNNIVIGRKKGDIVLGFDSAVSGEHCRISKKGDLYYIEDLKSGNGTTYDGVRIYDEVFMAPGGILEIGRGKYRVIIND